MGCAFTLISEISCFRWVIWWLLLSQFNVEIGDRVLAVLTYQTLICPSVVIVLLVCCFLSFGSPTSQCSSRSVVIALIWQSIVIMVCNLSCQSSVIVCEIIESIDTLVAINHFHCAFIYTMMLVKFHWLSNMILMATFSDVLLPCGNVLLHDFLTWYHLQMLVIGWNLLCIFRQKRCFWQVYWFGLPTTAIGSIRCTCGIELEFSAFDAFSHFVFLVINDVNFHVRNF